MEILKTLKTCATFPVLAFLTFASALSVFTTTCFASTITLQWNPVTAPDLAGYKIYYSTTSTAPFTGTGAVQGASPVDVAAQTSATLTGLDAGQEYYFAVTAYNTAGVESPYSEIVSVSELIPPTVSITSPTGTTQATGTVSVTASASDNVGVSKLEFYVNGALQATDTSTPYLYSWDSSSAPAGVYTLMAKAYDAAGNVGVSSNVAVTVVHDTTPPTTALASPANGATVQGTVAVAATANDDLGVSRVELYANGVLLAAGNVPPFTYNWDTTGVANGSYVLYSKAYDAAGNVGESGNVTVKVFNDSIPPSVSIAQPTGNSTVNGSVTVSANATDNDMVSRVDFYINGVLQASTATAPYAFQWNTAGIGNGSYTISAIAYDSSGNMAQAPNIAVMVLNDTTAPAISMASPVGGTVGGTVAVTANATDNVGVTKVEFYLNGVLQGTSTSAPYSFTWNTANSPNGSNSLSAKAYDAAGNVGQSAAVAVTVFNDTSAPAITFSAPTTTYVYGSKVRISASAADNVAVQKMELYIDGTLKATSKSSSLSDSVPVSKGVHLVTVKAYDPSNNVTTATRTINRIY